MTAELTFNEVISSELLSDCEAVLEHVRAGKPLDAGVASRVRERATTITEEIRRKHGTLDLGVPTIRELRDSA